ncbi:hypothetical protein WV31_10830 [Magnetospirillum sp. ME-1]|uniref:hypothetical protein n=1 Tax=Magnetospirillum sp. ME-1 TaxID=1639348 RepID=UPI000A17E20C|nr:hypothetical protein [Magnetospirillum sp. ME-1]ARJ66122.1 hypothetical protein WV31_10830 [Magnetospirillum sp. ME-1]
MSANESIALARLAADLMAIRSVLRDIDRYGENNFAWLQEAQWTPSFDGWIAALGSVRANPSVEAIPGLDDAFERLISGMTAARTGKGTFRPQAERIRKAFLDADRRVGGSIREIVKPLGARAYAGWSELEYWFCSGRNASTGRDEAAAEILARAVPLRKDPKAVRNRLTLALAALLPGSSSHEQLDAAMALDAVLSAA